MRKNDSDMMWRPEMIAFKTNIVLYASLGTLSSKILFEIVRE